MVVGYKIIEKKMGNCESVDESKIQVPRQGAVSEILIHNYVWSKRYLGLFDYEAQEVHKRLYKVQGNSTVFKDADKLIMLDEKMEKLNKGLAEHYKNSIFRLIRNDNYYQIVPIVYEEKAELIQKPLWLVVRSLPTRSYSIRERDIIKLGKQKLKVREVVPIDYNPSVIIGNNENIRVSKAVYQQLNYKDKLQMKETESVNIEPVPGQSTKTIAIDDPTLLNDPQNENTCRICLQPGLTTNPLITPCKCIGTVRYIHLLCLKMWLSKQIKASISDFCVTINWKPLNCQMCKSHFKYRIYLDNQKFYTVDIPKPEKPYIVLEIMKKKNKEEGKIFKFITFRNKVKVNVGRKKDVDVRISEDISVSRIHATLRYKEDTREFILEDNKSKFGTLILAKNGLKIRPHHAGISVQIGAQMFDFQAIRAASDHRIPNYEMADDYMREEVSELSENDEQQGASEEQDEVMELPAEEGDNSPSHIRSPSIRRSHSVQVQPAEFS